MQYVYGFLKLKYYSVMQAGKPNFSQTLIFFRNSATVASNRFTLKYFDLLCCVSINQALAKTKSWIILKL